MIRKIIMTGMRRCFGWIHTFAGMTGMGDF